MDSLLHGIDQTLRHLDVLQKTFSERRNFAKQDETDYEIYHENLTNIEKTFAETNFHDQLYAEHDRQMILADLYEYFFLGRGFYIMKSRKDKEKFVKCILLFVNLLMCFESITVSLKLRRKVLLGLKEELPDIVKEKQFKDLFRFRGKVGLTQEKTDAPKELNEYFDTILPKTAGGLWHELLVYIFLLRRNEGYLLPLLLTQKIFAREDHLVPPDFLLITRDKRIYGLEVGTKKEIQSGSFSLRTAIPTATIDTANSRNSDRCPACNRWIQFCPYVIERYSNFDTQLDDIKVNCLKECTVVQPKDILRGRCKYTKYARNKAKTLAHTQHEFANGLHYHYKCVLNNVSKAMKRKIISAKDKVAIKTHYPYYSGLEELDK
ncbi:MAG: hypothetical protein ABSF91_03860 [Bacteroidota bacterium]|jgi:hypothetical protein